MQVAVIQYAAPGRDLKSALLLPFRFFDKFVVLKDLQPEEPSAQQDSPDSKKAQNDNNTNAPHRSRERRGTRVLGCSSGTGPGSNRRAHARRNGLLTRCGMKYNSVKSSLAA